ncbi:uncharacterized protein LOC134221488 [Armigeres subalbatus]|uniref:uncharacterized protein LOC134221488 n=1 Tax=Armigeres subalbatus TaxID=124917 RepID=UPI002ED26E44
MKCLISVFFIMGMLVYASSLLCYSCSSEDGTCNGERLIECDALSAALGMAMLVGLKPAFQIVPSATYKCYELVAIQQQTEVVFKSCIYNLTDVCEGSILNATQKECYTCTEDRCNGSGQVKMASVLGIAGLVVIFWMA